MPDFVFLVCEQPSALGGANVLLDGKAFLHGLKAGDDEDRDLVEWLQNKPVDLSETSAAGITEGRFAEGPVVQWHDTAGGRKRLKWRRQVNVKQAQQLTTWHPLSTTTAAHSSKLSCTNTFDVSYMS